jgi:hypothetical protein
MMFPANRGTVALLSDIAAWSLLVSNLDGRRAQATAVLDVEFTGSAAPASVKNDAPRVARDLSIGVLLISLALRLTHKYCFINSLR